MALYKERGVNPASGCVPMLLTLPFIFAFYALLSTAIELRGAPFVRLDSRSVGARSVLTCTPILMGVSQVWQQRIDAGGRRRSGAAEDDDVHAGRLHVHVPLVAGGRRALLAGQQRLGDRPAVLDELHDRPAEGPRRVPAGRAERRMKRVGGGKTDAARATDE